MMKKKIAIITALVVVSSATVLLLTGAAGSGNSKAAEVRVASLEKQDIEKSVSATGTVYSTRSTDVYSNLNYPVETVSVQVGDKVSEGDVLCELDTSSLEADIKQKQAAVWASQSAANQSLASAKSDLETYQRNVENGNDSSLANAQSGVTNAELDVQTAELEVQSASANLRAARRDLRDGRNNDLEDSELDKLRDNVNSCETSLEKAQTNLEKAKASLENAKASYETTKISSGDSLVTYENKVKSAQLSTNFNDQYIAIQKMQDDLGNASVLSPVFGTVTAVNVVPGGSGSGLLFVIQETDELKVITNIKEYDIASVSLGDTVKIKSDATGDAVFTGTLSLIAPTSTLTAKGSTQSSTTAEYECEVSAASGNGLKIGMNTRLSVITQQKKDVYAVPYEAVVTNEAGDKIVYISVPQEDGGYLAQAVPVTTGMETDLRVEVSGEALTDGALIIKSAEGIQDGMPVAPQGV